MKFIQVLTIITWFLTCLFLLLWLVIPTSCLYWENDEPCPNDIYYDLFISFFIITLFFVFTFFLDVNGYMKFSNTIRSIEDRITTLELIIKKQQQQKPQQEQRI